MTGDIARARVMTKEPPAAILKRKYGERLSSRFTVWRLSRLFFVKGV